MKRKLKWTAAVLAVFLLGLAAALFLWPRDRITGRSLEKIRHGMSMKEVEDILGDHDEADIDRFRQIGQLPVNTNTYRKVVMHRFLLRQEANSLLDPEIDTKVWIGARAIIAVQFDRAGHVTGLVFLGPNETTRPNILDRLRDWLGW